MQDDQEEKMLPGSLISSSWFKYTLITLLIIVGSISFIYANGITTVQNLWSELTLPDLSLELNPSNLNLPADGSTTGQIDAIIKNNQGQLLDGTDIMVTVPAGTIDLTRAPEALAGISQRFIVRTSLTPQTVTLTFNFKHLQKTLTVETFDPTPPLMPIIKSPANNTNFSTAIPIVSGQTLTNHQVEIYVDDQFNTLITPLKGSDLFEAPLEQALSRGRHKMTATSINKYGVKSQPSPAIYINIQTPDPEIDIANLRIKPNPAKAGEAAYIFIPVSASTKSVTIMVDNANYQLTDQNQSSIFSGVIRAPQKAGLYRISAVVVGEGGDSILASNIATLRVQ